MDCTMTEALRDDENNALLHGPVRVNYQPMIAINMTDHWLNQKTEKILKAESREYVRELVQITSKLCG